MTTGFSGPLPAPAATQHAARPFGLSGLWRGYIERLDPLAVSVPKLTGEAQTVNKVETSPGLPLFVGAAVWLASVEGNRNDFLVVGMRGDPPLETPNGGDLSIVAGLTGAGVVIVGGSGGGQRTITAGLTAAGAVNRTGGGALAVTATLRGDGKVAAKWLSSVTTQTLNSVAGCTVSIDWRASAGEGRMVDMRFFIDCPSAPGASTGILGIALPATLPFLAADVSPSTGSRGAYGSCLAAGSPSEGNTSIVARVDAGSPPGLILFFPVFNGWKSFEGSVTWNTATP